ncbi:Uncharacterised protein [Candidatus Bilamarchaeum dharawalense]|uniref:Uncharacterized protein n=1 Tax=Candidatus Bilamarchaeum dharawalense TaxID=2885759 RepID=A0A5E4LTK1_9ARCH|nr:Uncharacterised protein [Candidatus Bilamarchaeum dharawalense]
MADQVLLPKKGGGVLDLTKPIVPSKEMMIRWAKEYLEDPKWDLDVKRNSITILAENGEREYLIQWAKRYLESTGKNHSLDRDAVGVLIDYKEMKYLKTLQGWFEKDLESMKKELGALEKQRLGLSLNLGAQAYVKMREFMSDEEWERLPKKEQLRLSAEAYAKYVGPIMTKVEDAIKKLERQISEMETLLDDIRRGLQKE